MLLFSSTFCVNLMKPLEFCVFYVITYPNLVKWSTKRCKYFFVDRELPKRPMASIDTISNGSFAGPN